MRESNEIQLEEAEFFRALAPETLDRIRPRLLPTNFTRQKTLYFAGATADYLWVLRSGEVRLYKSSADGRLATLETLSPGGAFGVIGALEEDLYTASAEAVTNGSAWRLPRSFALSLLESEPQLAIEVLKIVSSRLYRAHERMRSFAHDPAPARLAAALLEAAVEGEARVTRRALAEATGTTVETAIRVLRRFEKEGLIRGAVGRVELLDIETLDNMSGGKQS